MKKTILSLMAVVALMCSTGCSKGGEPKPDPKSVTTYEVNGVKFNMVSIKGGTFTMGSADYGSYEQPTHEVTLSAYAIGETEVTQELWEAVMGSNPSFHTGKKNLPVENVSWSDCLTFIHKLNQATGELFRLPTEAEWEYAARGGEKSKGYKYSGSNNPDDVAWHLGNSSEQTHPIKGKKANELGLYDMSGNVWEWCMDWYDNEYYANSPKKDPNGPSIGTARVIRGGGIFSADGLRVTSRSYWEPAQKDVDQGFRLARYQ